MQKSADLIKPVKSRDELAKIAGVSHDTIEKVKFIEREATEEQKQSLSKGEKKVNTVYLICLPVNLQVVYLGRFFLWCSLRCFEIKLCSLMWVLKLA